MRMNYYYMHFTENDDNLGIGQINSELLPEDLCIQSEISIDVLLKDGHVRDFLPNNIGYPLFSEKFKNLLVGEINCESCKWVRVNVLNEDGDIFAFYFLCFSKDIDILDYKRSIITMDDMVVKPVISLEKIKGIDVVNIPKSVSRILVSEKVKKVVDNSDLLGFAFTKAPVGK